jgi:hypothetical protein
MTSKDNARVLFDKLSLDYVKGELLGKAFENNWFECKQKADPNVWEVNDGDWLYFAKAQSGFANTSGGVLIWGLEAVKKEEVDLVQSIKDIHQLQKFESRIRELETRGIERLVEGIEYKSIPTKGDSGVLAVYIPQSKRPPHRSLRDYKFYMRAGGVFTSIDLKVIEELFHRRLTPKLKFFVRQENSQAIRLCLRNVGEATAKSPFVVFSMPNAIGPTGYEMDGNTRLVSCIQMSNYRGSAGRFMQWQDGANRVVHPDQELQIIELRCRAGGNFPSGNRFQFEYYVYAEGMPPETGKYEFTAA